MSIQTPAEIALRRAGIGWADAEVVELKKTSRRNRLPVGQIGQKLNPTIVNVNGGSIAVGHPTSG
ncbi:hypothetical protein [Rhodococcus koreensis]|uniref:hypothetical protein n=1 Tax=Rhodococcus koreensis TaxID=99653 RepID=UPI00366DEEAB